MSFSLLSHCDYACLASSDSGTERDDERERQGGRRTAACSFKAQAGHGCFSDNRCTCGVWPLPRWLTVKPLPAKTDPSGETHPLSVGAINTFGNGDTIPVRLSLHARMSELVVCASATVPPRNATATVEAGPVP